MRKIIISFSSRVDGNCNKIANFIAQKVANSVIFLFSEIHIIPCGSCHYECFLSREACPHISDAEYHLLNAITHCEEAYFVVPNYCDYPCANFFIFNERSQCYFQGHPELLEKYLNVPKKFIVVSNSASETFRQAFIQHTAVEPEILFLRAKHYEKQSIAGDILTSQSAEADLEGFI